MNRPTGHSFRTAPDNVAGENYFNRIEVAGMDPNALEKGLAEFEGEVAPALGGSGRSRSLKRTGRSREFHGGDRAPKSVATGGY